MRRGVGTRFLTRALREPNRTAMTDPKTLRLLSALEGLPEDAIDEVADFAEFLRSRRGKTEAARVTMHGDSWRHLEAEFDGYEERHPRD